MVSFKERCCVQKWWWWMRRWGWPPQSGRSLRRRTCPAPPTRTSPARPPPPPAQPSNSPEGTTLSRNIFSEMIDCEEYLRLRPISEPRSAPVCKWVILWLRFLRPPWISYHPHPLTELYLHWFIADSLHVSSWIHFKSHMCFVHQRVYLCHKDDDGNRCCSTQYPCEGGMFVTPLWAFL